MSDGGFCHYCRHPITACRCGLVQGTIPATPEPAPAPSELGIKKGVRWTLEGGTPDEFIEIPYPPAPDGEVEAAIAWFENGLDPRHHGHNNSSKHARVLIAALRAQSAPPVVEPFDLDVVSALEHLIEECENGPRDDGGNFDDCIRDAKRALRARAAQPVELTVEIEAVKRLEEWVDIQIDGIQQSSMVEASRGAVNAFKQVKKQLALLRSKAGAGDREEGPAE